MALCNIIYYNGIENSSAYNCAYSIEKYLWEIKSMLYKYEEWQKLVFVYEWSCCQFLGQSVSRTISIQYWKYSLSIYYSLFVKDIESDQWNDITETEENDVSK